MLNGKKKKGAEVISSVNMHKKLRFSETKHSRRQDRGPRRVAGIPSANSRVAVGGSEAEKGTSATDERYLAKSCVEHAAGTQGPTFSSSRWNTFRRRHQSKGTKDGDIKNGQLYGAGSAEDAVSERRARALHRKNGRKGSLPRVLSVS